MWCASGGLRWLRCACGERNKSKKIVSFILLYYKIVRNGHE
ncbi:MAG TPA: hypothetical protein DEF41_02015 [Desulfovibrio sp.]|uniref:Uncharacterized protein n=1 Tax=Nitratidesulfovibrio vulgaris (strain ATCC 29579 / DSM 644 / CCUG 34227 / NCIMB 8303 / VKM B-1760 / Hildenborough) TaxID=882 RepID=Q725P4_NITV2|nr:hypothetical protein DVU_3380 [Nitratidesulfovibrio vulgaris str. Hildenborough]HBW14928.1 hypothetical protein [Desulfovibrio sp.]